MDSLSTVQYIQTDVRRSLYRDVGSPLPPRCLRSGHDGTSLCSGLRWTLFQVSSFPHLPTPAQLGVPPWLLLPPLFLLAFSCKTGTFGSSSLEYNHFLFCIIFISWLLNRATPNRFLVRRHRNRLRVAHVVLIRKSA